MENKNTLSHAGIKGMRWGVRRYQNKDGSLTPEGKKRYGDPANNHDDYNKARAKTSVKSMSDAELRASINRLQMEKQYTQLTQKEKSTGRKWVESLLLESSKDIAKSYVTKYAKKGIDALGAKAITKIVTK